MQQDANNAFAFHEDWFGAQWSPWQRSLHAFKATIETKAHGGVRFMGHIIKPGGTFTIAGIKPRGRGRRKLTQFRIVGVM